MGNLGTVSLWQLLHYRSRSVYLSITFFVVYAESQPVKYGMSSFFMHIEIIIIILWASKISVNRHHIFAVIPDNDHSLPIMWLITCTTIERGF